MCVCVSVCADCVQVLSYTVLQGLIITSVLEDSSLYDLWLILMFSPITGSTSRDMMWSSGLCVTSPTFMQMIGALFLHSKLECPFIRHFKKMIMSYSRVSGWLLDSTVWSQITKYVALSNFSLLEKNLSVTKPSVFSCNGKKWKIKYCEGIEAVNTIINKGAPQRTGTDGSLHCTCSCNNTSYLYFMKTALQTVALWHIGSTTLIWHCVILNFCRR